MITSLKYFASAVFALSCSSAIAQQPALDFSALGYLPDFSYAGYASGAAPIPSAQGQAVSVDDYGAKPDDTADDTKAVQKALAAAHAIDGPVVLQFSPGRYIITDILKIQRSDIVLQGAGQGAGGTTLSFPRPLAMVPDTSALDELREYLVEFDKRQVEKKANLDVLFSEYSWSGGFIWVARKNARPAAYLPKYDPRIEKRADITSGERGGFKVLVRASNGLAPGDVLQIHWFNTKGKDGPLIDEIYGDADIQVGSHHWTFPKRPLVRQMVEVAAVDGDTVTLVQPLLHSINKSLPAQFSSWQHLTNVGIEGLHLEFPNAPYFGHHVERGYNAIYYTSVYNGWIRDVRVTNADSGVLSYDSANVTMERIVTDGPRKAHYSVHLGSVHGVLVKDLTVFNPTRHTLSFNTKSTRNVYSGAALYAAPVLDQHAGSNHQNLFDNITAYVSPKRKNDQWRYALFNGSGAGYWQPGHGAFNTSWNVNVIIQGGPYPGDEVMIEALDEGPNARIVGLRGNRPLSLDYRPQPVVKFLNQMPPDIPSLYSYQLAQRRAQLSP